MDVKIHKNTEIKISKSVKSQIKRTEISNLIPEL